MADQIYNNLNQIYIDLNQIYNNPYQIYNNSYQIYKNSCQFYKFTIELEARLAIVEQNSVAVDGQSKNDKEAIANTEKCFAEDFSSDDNLLLIPKNWMKNPYRISNKKNVIDQIIKTRQIITFEYANPTILKLGCMRSLLWELPISKLDALEEKLKHEKTIDDLCIEGIQNLISSLDAFLDEKSNTSEAEDIYLKIYSSGILTNGEIVYATNNRICYGKVLILAEISLLPNNHPTFPIALIRWYDYCSKRHLTKYGCSYMKLINSYDIIPFDSIVEVVHMVKRSFKDPKNSKILKDSLVILGFFKDPHLKKLTDEFGSTQWRDYYKAEVNQKVFGNKLRELSTAEGTEEELYSLSCKYCMNRTELRLRAYYVTILNKPADQLMVSL
ncbi:hypothetical protein RhiirA4_455649 [Rhizophagus irregularis]|uniref:BAH domain-containing protein n=1 Tax=Rhizophagus irregularis TaxID=588596 RepID=A0A2I1G5V7_9GLOM|nr:hypothetical protein RhiirA4_455649 [Rhizophagus irregularis]